ncbi:MAG: enoyl-CoA hydratase/isomerase family protein [Clostridioides sp.]|jgi:2-(1,2-epoxy-1,2-dihydrophenyl)acetyl-CoA isomerase|nr:enoyl-CoA hydratase/isomerase family protein [Clostridioides sp.]
MYETILLEVEDRVATITINRPEVSNAFAVETYSEIKNALEACSENDEVGAVVITGVGKNFSAGGDIKRFRGLIDSKTYISPDGVWGAGHMAMAARRCSKPVIAMVNGAAAGAGCGLALAADFRIVTPKSKLIMAFINLGLTGDTLGMYFLEKAVGTARTAEIMMSGDPIRGEKAFEYGLATKLVDDESFVEETYAFAKKMANRPLFAIKRQKQTINQFFYPDLEKFIACEADNMHASSKTEDFNEAVNAFLEKRPPVFTGK